MVITFSYQFFREWRWAGTDTTDQGSAASTPAQASPSISPFRVYRCTFSIKFSIQINFSRIPSIREPMCLYNVHTDFTRVIRGIITKVNANEWNTDMTLNRYDYSLASCLIAGKLIDSFQDRDFSGDCCCRRFLADSSFNKNDYFCSTNIYIWWI